MPVVSRQESEYCILSVVEIENYLPVSLKAVTFPERSPTLCAHYILTVFSLCSLSFPFLLFFFGIHSNPAARRTKKLWLTGEKCPAETAGAAVIVSDRQRDHSLVHWDNIT